MRGELKLPSALERKQLGDAARKGKLLKKTKRVRERVSGGGIIDIPPILNWGRHGGQLIIDEWADVRWHDGGVFKLPIEWKGEWNLEVLAERIKDEPAKDPTDEWLENYKKENL